MAPSVPSTLNPHKLSQDVLEVIRMVHWTPELLELVTGIVVNPELAAAALEPFYELHRQGKTGHVKKYVDFEKGNAHWHMGDLLGFVNAVAGNKNICFGNPPVVKEEDIASSFSDGMLRDKETGFRLFTMDNIAGSDLRTGWFAGVYPPLAFNEGEKVKVGMIGAGAVGKACIQALAQVCPDLVESVTIYNWRGNKQHVLAKALNDDPNVPFPVQGTDHRDEAVACRYIILATSAGKPVLFADDIRQDTHILSQGIRDMHPDAIKKIIEMGGTLIGDDLEAMADRNVDPIVCYYSDNGKSVLVEGRKDGAVNIGDLLANPARFNKANPSVFAPVGLVGYDICIMLVVFMRVMAFFAGKSAEEALALIHEGMRKAAALKLAATN